MDAWLVVLIVAFVLVDLLITFLVLRRLRARRDERDRQVTLGE